MDPFTAAFLIVSLIIAVVAYVLSNTAKKAKPDLQNLDIPVNKEGKTIGLIYGTELIKDLNVVNYYDLQIIAEAKSGGKKQ